MVIVAGNHNEDVLQVIDEQFKNNETQKLGLYLNGLGLFELLPVLYKIASQNRLKKEELQKAVEKYNV